MDHASNSLKLGIKSLVSGVLIGYAITIIVFIAYALLLTYTGISEANIGLVVTLTSILSVLVAGFDAARVQTRRGWLWGLAAGLCYGILLIVLMMAFQGGAISISRSASLLILALAGGGLGGVLGINFQRKK